jgi:hypothetical protein
MKRRIVFHTSSILLLLSLLPGCTSTNEPEQPVPVSGSTIKGRVIDQATSHPVAFARAGLTSTARLRFVLSATDGGFAFTGVTPGQYHVTVDRAEYGPATVEVPPGIQDTSSLTVALVRKTAIPLVKPLSKGIFRINAKHLEEDYNGDGIYQPLRVKGVAFSPTPIGAYTYNHDGVDRSMPYLDSIHANAIRTYSGADPYLLIAAANHSVYVIVSFWVDASYDLADPAAREGIIQNFSSMVQTLKNYPAVLMWNLGNEQNLPTMNGNNPYWYDLAQELAVAAFEIEGAYYHPVCANNGDFDSIGDPAKRADDSSLTYMDLWGCNIYKLNLAPSMAYYRTRTQKPVVITECGIDALNNLTKVEYEAVQSRQDSLNWAQIVNAQDVCVGATFFEFTDEWWKAGDPLHHDFGGYPSPEHPDGFSNEEWWGFIAVTPDTSGDGYDEWRPRQVFRMFQRVWQ